MVLERDLCVFVNELGLCAVVVASREPDPQVRIFRSVAPQEALKQMNRGSARRLTVTALSAHDAKRARQGRHRLGLVARASRRSGVIAKRACPHNLGFR
jgi:hypothetical protein